jgi:molybdopterin/thiamine biosynthesis adenylyltransferase
MEIIEGYDVIVDGLDNFPTRYLLNDASVRLEIPVVSASILGFEGQLSVFHPYEGPCYRCLYPTPPPAELAPSCGAAGVLGVLPGVMGLR